MAADSKTNIKQLKVDNWAVFFLQRLQLLFAKGDFCDLTLKFPTGQELKAHRLVLSTCTTYFESIESKGNVIELPETLPYVAVHPIINFLYSGRLEFKPDLHAQLLAVSKLLNITILAQLLVAQKNDNGTTSIGIGKSPEVKKMIKNPLASKFLSNYPINNTLSGKKLPIWRQRTIPYRSFLRKPIEDEEPKPTRFEWPIDETCNNILMNSPSFSSLSYESAPPIQSPILPPPSPPPPLLPLPPQPLLKRKVSPTTPTPIPEKFFKPDKPLNEEFKQEVDPSTPPPPPNEEDDDDDDDGHFETLHTYGDSDDDTPQEPVVLPQQLKPILKPVSDSPSTTPGKKVRFAFAPEDKKNSNDKLSEETESKGAQVAGDKNDVSNHAKIIAEVLKKYPDLVKHNKNIKLKISAPGSSGKPNTVTVAPKKTVVQGKSSYVVIKSSVKPKSTQLTTIASLEDSTPTYSKNVDNTTGPWECATCGNENGPLVLESYFDYRKHLQNVHMERIDSRICEYCGYKASKRNVHLYHLYTKHDVLPPKNINFPKCDSCGYIALSESLLIKHKNSHINTKELTCNVCNTIFKSPSNLHAHSLTCKANNELRNFTCDYCKKNFKTNVGLNTHVKVCLSRDGNSGEGNNGSGGTNIYDEVEEREGIEVMVPIKTEGPVEQLPSNLILTEPSNVALLPSSESEGLNNVASGIAASIGLTVALPQDHQQAVILLDGGSEFIFEGNESVVVTNVTNDNEVHEYIVPEMLTANMEQIYARNLPYSVSSGNVITCPVVPVQTEAQIDQNRNNKLNLPGSSNQLTKDHNYADGKAKEIEQHKNHQPTHMIAEGQIGPSCTNKMYKNNSQNNIKERNIITINLTSDSETTGDPVSVDNHIDEVKIDSQTSTEIKPEEETQTIENHSDVIVEDNTNPVQEPPIVVNKEDQIVRANSLVKDWGFDNEEDCEDNTVDDVDNLDDSKPCRITEDI